MAKNDLSVSLEKTLEDLQKVLSDTAELNITKACVCGTPAAVVSARIMTRLRHSARNLFMLEFLLL